MARWFFLALTLYPRRPREGGEFLVRRWILECFLGEGPDNATKSLNTKRCAQIQTCARVTSAYRHVITTP